MKHTETAAPDRRHVLLSGLAVGGLGLTALFLPTAHARAQETEGQSDEFPHMNRASVRAFVTACHGQVDVVREMLQKRPGLVHAAWDWGFGDFETGLGAASHTGQREIAELLIAGGARVDIFAATMLGWTDAVNAMIAADPRIKSALGPHCLPLLHHARVGGPSAAATLALLEKLGGADQSPILTASKPSDARVAACVGTYRFAAFNTTLQIRKDAKGRLECVPADSTSRLLYQRRDLEFFPSGVPSVTLKFAESAESSPTLTVNTGDEEFVGMRTP